MFKNVLLVFSVRIVHHSVPDIAKTLIVTDLMDLVNARQDTEEVTALKVKYFKTFIYLKKVLVYIPLFGIQICN